MADPRESERRHVTVMFADVSGFTAMARAMDPEDVAELMNACLGILERTVVEHGGHVDKYIGDCVMALFGAPAAMEDAPRQAVNAAIVMLKRIAEFTGERGIADRVDVHVGINTGLVVYGDIGGASARDTTAMGDTVNIASRLRDVAGTQCIYVGPQTRHETAADFRYRRVLALQLKGVGGNYDAWEVLSRDPQRHRSLAGESGPGLASPLVGRDEALAAIERAARRLESGSGAVLAFTGEAGIGKSRLLLEMRRSSHVAEALCLEGRALRIGESRGLNAFADLLRCWADLRTGLVPDEQRAQVLAGLRALFGDSTPEVYPFLAVLAGFPLASEDARRVEGIDGEGMQRLITRNLLELLQRLSARVPLVVMFDDLHWADQSTLDLLLRLLGTMEHHPILFVLAMRPDVDSPSTAFVRTLRSRHPDRFVQVPLEPLDPKASSELLRERISFDERPDQTRRAILSRAEGNPFFIEEIIRSLVDVGAIRHTPEGLRVTGQLSGVEVPGTVQELVMDRVDRLPPAVREVLQSASVVGRRFPVRILQAVACPDGAGDSALQDALADLERRGFLERSPSGADHDYAFKHALAHETVYEGILRRKRREMHLAVGRMVEEMFAEQLHSHYASLAYHFSRAEDWPKASHYLLKAGDEAARSAASNEALRCFAEAASIHDRLHGEGTRPEERAEIEKKIGLACLGKGDLPEALDHIDRALALLGYSTPSGRLHVLWRLGADLAAIVRHLYLSPATARKREPPALVAAITELCFHKGKAQSTTAPQGYVLSMLPAIRAVGAWDFRGIEHACGVYSAGAALFAWSGLSFRIARRLSRAGSALVSTVPDSVIHGTMRFVAYYLEGDWAEANTLPESLVDDALRYGAFWEVNTYLGMHCERRIHQGRLLEGAAVIQRLEEIGDLYGYEFSHTNVCAMRTFLHFQAGHFDLALEAVERYYEVCSEEALILLALGTRARVLLALGRDDAATSAIEQGERLARAIGRQAAPYHLAPLRLARLEHDILRLEKAADGERRLLERAVAASRRLALGAVARIARDRPACYRAVARLEWNRGRRPAALDWWRRAMREAKALGALPELARAYREVGERLLAEGDTTLRVDGYGAEEMLERAIEFEARVEDEWRQSTGDATPEALSA
ncbi:MAG: adenylate/guanylate cyclase domain-containing protein [Candidatus Binatia bacterium]